LTAAVVVWWKLHHTLLGCNTFPLRFSRQESRTQRPARADRLPPAPVRNTARLTAALLGSCDSNYYARIKIRGKTIRRSLDTDVFTTAKLKLLDFLEEERKKRTAAAPPTFAEAQQLYEQKLDNDPAVKPQSRQHRRWCIRKLGLSWPGLKALRLDQIKPETCREWAAKLSEEIACHYYNNTIATLRLIIDAGIKEHRNRGGAPLENPWRTLRTCFRGYASPGKK
jgi:hypothetical protein